MKRTSHVTSLILRITVYAGACVASLLIAFIIGYILVKGIPHLRPELFSWKYNSANVSLMTSLFNTIWTTAIALLFAVPTGICAAVYMCEYVSRGSRMVKLIRLTSETLAGIPSIVYGLFGLLFFVTASGWGMSLLAGACTLALMVLPLIMRTTEEALLSVPDGFREASFGLGAGKLRTVFRIVIPSAVPGILSGVILAIGRIVGETAALIYTSGTVPEVPANVMGSARTLSVHLYVLSSEGLYVNQTYATAVVLLVLVLSINTLAAFVAKKLNSNFTAV